MPRAGSIVVTTPPVLRTYKTFSDNQWLQLIWVALTSAGTQPTNATSPAAISVLTSVASSATSVSLKAANTLRKSMIIKNESTSTLYIAYAATASLLAYTVVVAPGDVWELDNYTGAISGIWDVAQGFARITELT